MACFTTAREFAMNCQSEILEELNALFKERYKIEIDCNCSELYCSCSLFCHIFIYAVLLLQSFICRHIKSKFTQICLFMKKLF